MISIPLLGLDQFLVKYSSAYPEAGNQLIDYIIDVYPSQRPLPSGAKSILLAEEAGEASLADIDTILAGLPEGKKGYLAQTSIIRELGHEISQHQLRLDAQNRPY